MSTKHYWILTALLLASLQISLAGTARYVSASVGGERETNQVVIAANEVGELISWGGSYLAVDAYKDGIYANIINSQSPPGKASFTVAGPAAFNLRAAGGPSSNGFATFKITPESFPPDKTLLVEPNQGNVAITMESSTNLIHWVASTNGIYSTTNTPMFFRVRMDKGQ